MQICSVGQINDRNTLGYRSLQIHFKKKEENTVLWTDHKVVLICSGNTQFQIDISSYKKVLNGSQDFMFII